MGAVLIGIDLGTGSSKGVLTTPEGEILATAIRPRPRSMVMPRPNWAEVDADLVWWADVASISAELMSRIGNDHVAAVCISGAGPCLVLTDDDDRPVRPAIMYGIDMRATAEIAELTAEFGAELIFTRCGKSLTTQAIGPKIRWVARHEPEVWQRARRWFNSSSYIVRRLTDAYVVDHLTASQCDPLYDIIERRWIEPWTDAIVGHLAMPEVVWATEVVGSVTDEAAALTGLPAGTPVCAGTIDAWSEAFSAGVRRPGDVMIMYGSTIFLVQVLREAVSHPQLWTTAGVDRESYTLAAGMATSGSLTSWMQDLTGGVPFEDLVAEAAEAPIGSAGLLILPYFAGERTPIFDARARGVIAGLTLRHTRGHLFRAVYEGIAFGIRQILELLDSRLGSVDRLVAVGGGTRGGLWTQIVSDVTGREQIVPAQTIGASYGDALMAAIGAGLVAPDTDWARASQVIRPNPAAAEIYDELYRSYNELYPATRGVVHRLAQLQERIG
ncbi:MAG TPA: FGGY-family carbohydrate kinase [Propionibacteriaceae bacterium]|nr:FGGY-family carbohydrate kinase [Propionibacteriaceae bacterium]